MPQSGDAIHSRCEPIPGGGKLGVAQYGRPDGRPIFYFHGLSGSRLEASLTDRIADDLGIRVVSFDRPGMGLSTFRQDRKITDIALDTQHLADALGIGKFSVLGVSGGAPYALACGIRLPRRVTRIGLVCPAGPFHEKRYRSAIDWKMKIVLYLAILTPGWFRRLLRKTSRIMISDPERFLLRWAEHAGSPDREVLLANMSLFSANLREAFLSGEAGAVHDAGLLFQQWGFEPSEATQSVFLWHGGRDRTIPQGVGIRLSEEIPGCHSIFPPDEGHFSLPVGWAREILSTLVMPVQDRVGK